VISILEVTEKEVQDTSCRGSDGIPQLEKVPQSWGIRGLIKTISALSLFASATVI
jgi:hypothetical protein